MRVLIADDEPLARERLRRLLLAMPDYRLVGEAATGAEVLELARRMPVDAILLDIQMPGLDGLAAARELSALPTPPALIFVTAFGEHALAAFETLASGYLLKPVSESALREALVRAQRRTRAQEKTEEFITAVAHGERRRVPVREVLLFIAEDKYTRVVHLGGDWLIEESLRSLELRLPGFVRVHRNCLVARSRVRALDTEVRLHLEGYGEPIPVSRRCLAEVRKLLSHPE